MLFDSLSNYAHLVDVDDSVSCKMMQAVQSDFDEYEGRLLKLKEALAAEFRDAVFSMNQSLATLTAECRVQESAAEEESARQRVRNRIDNDGAMPIQSFTSHSTQPGSSQQNSNIVSHGSKLAEFWKLKFSELQGELEETKEKHAAMLRKLEDPRSAPLSRLTKTVSSLNESTVLARMHADKYAALTQGVCNRDPTQQQVEGGSIAEASSWEKALRHQKESGLQKIMQALTAEGNALHRAHDLAKSRLRDLHDKSEKLKSRLSAVGGSNVLDDVLYLRAELRAAQQESIEDHTDSVEGVADPVADSAAGGDSSGDLPPESLEKELRELESKVREVRVAIIRAEHRSKDASQIVRRAVCAEKARSQRDRVTALESEKLKLLQEVNKVSLKAHYDATWLAKAAS